MYYNIKQLINKIQYALINDQLYYMKKIEYNIRKFKFFLEDIL